MTTRDGGLCIPAADKIAVILLVSGLVRNHATLEVQLASASGADAEDDTLDLAPSLSNACSTHRRADPPGIRNGSLRPHASSVQRPSPRAQDAFAPSPMVSGRPNDGKTVLSKATISVISPRRMRSTSTANARNCAAPGRCR